ncbi:MAG: phosphotransferase [Pseudomonadota bacterium]
MSVEVQGADEQTVQQFLKKAGWADAVYEPMAADMGLRRYARLKRDGQKALFMDMSRAGILETGLGNYIKIAEHCRSHNIRVPAIYSYDLETGLAVVEDLGRISFGNARKVGAKDVELYGLATKILGQIRDSDRTNDLKLTGYKDTLIYKRLQQFVDWYMTVATSRQTTKSDQDAFYAALAEIEENLPNCPMAICHADYHLENLIWCPEHPQGYGLIDFQDAFWGPMPYDLLNLLEDARQTVPEDIKTTMKEKYCEGMGAEAREAFDAWYVYMSMQFHCRVSGLFIKFSIKNNGVEFLDHIPRLQGYIGQNLEHPLMRPLKRFFDENKVSLNYDRDIKSNIDFIKVSAPMLTS